MQNDQKQSPQEGSSEFPFSPPPQGIHYQAQNTLVQPTQALPPPITPPSSIENSRKFNLAKMGKIVIGAIVILIILALVLFISSKFLGTKEENPTLSFWGLWEDGKTMQSVLSDFERQNPNIKIEYSKEDLKQYKDRLLTRADNGNGPDVFLYHNTWYSMLSNILLPLPAAVITNEQFSSAYFNVAKTDLVKNGAIYGIPQNADTLIMYVNTDILRSAGVDVPSNWNDFIDTARRLTVKDEDGKIKTAGAAMGTYGNVTHAPDILSLLFLQNGVELDNLEATGERLTGALNFYTAFALDENNVWDESMDPSILAFSKGNLAMYFGYSWDYFTIKAANPNINLQIVPVPQLGNEPVNLASYWVMGASIKSKYQKDALNLISYLSKKEVVEKLYSEAAKGRAFGQPYPRADLIDSLRETIIYPSILQASTARSSYFVDVAGESGMNQELNVYLENAINSINEGTSAETAFDTLKQGVAQVFDKYGQQ